MRIPPMPFKILVLAPFRSQDADIWRQKPVRVDKTNLDEVLGGMGLSLTLNLPVKLCPTGELTLRFNTMKDFHPDGLINSNPFLKNLLDAKRFVEEAGTKGLSSEEVCSRIEGWPDLPPIDLRIASQEPKSAPSSPVDDILKMVALPNGAETSYSTAAPLISQLDTILRQILREIFSHDTFRELESMWRGLRFFMKYGEVNGEVKLEIVPVLKETLEETLGSLLAHTVHDPPSLLVIDLPFDSTPRSLGLLEVISQFSETLLAPAISWVTPKFLFIDTWQDLEKLPFLPHYLEESVFAKWQRLRQISSGRWIAVTCNRFLLRYPYGPDNKPVLAYFEETQRPWASPVWALACLIGKIHVKTGWPTRFTEWQRVTLEDLALHPVGPGRLLPTEANFSEERAQQFVKGGIIPLVSAYNKDIAFMPGETTVAGTSLSYQLLVNRVTQFLIWCKDNFSKDLKPSEVEEDLEKAFSIYWERTGQPGPNNLEVSVVKNDPDKPAVVRFMIEPSRQVLLSGEKVEVELNW
jgi:type VI secretion system protein ImpC